MDITDDENIYIEIGGDGIGRKHAEEIQANSNRDHKSTGMKSMESKQEVLRKLVKIDIDYRIIDLFNNKLSSGTKVIIRISNK